MDRIISKYITTFFLGFNSGVSYATLGAVLTIYLNDFSISYVLLGFLSLRLLPYSFKGFWSPVLDIMPMRLFPAGFGHRKSWVVFTQIIIALCFLIFGLLKNPQDQIWLITINAVVAAFMAASYDNVLHGYRIELFPQELQPKANTIISISFKIGFFASLGASLVITEYLAWEIFFIVLSLVYIPGIVIFIFSYEKKSISKNLSISQNFKQVKRNYFAPFMALVKSKYALPIAIIVMFFKASDSFMDTLLVPYLLEIGFSKTQTAGYSKFIGFISYTIGTLVGGYFLHKKIHIIKTMICVEILSAISNLGFIPLMYYKSTLLLSIVSLLESMSSSMCNIVLITFLSYFSKSTLRFSGTFYAVLQSLSLLNRFIISSFSGLTVEVFGWKVFLIASSLLSIPALCGCFYLLSRQEEATSFFRKAREAE
ncbi:MAG: MFS transporter [Rickettsiales bacterium]